MRHDKSSIVFGEYLRLAEEHNRKVIIYYGPSGHGKGLCDAMSSFGVKAPLLKAVITDDFKYNSAKDICDLMQNLFVDDAQKVHYHIKAEEILKLRQEGGKSVKIPGCMAIHMLCFNPDGSILQKTNICSCSDCLAGNFDHC